MDDIKPTRSELMKLKKKIKLAQGGYNLLKKKRDGLILDFFEILKKAKDVRKEMRNEYQEAKEKLNIARALYGDLTVKSIAIGVQDRPLLHISSKNIMGVVVPKIEAKLPQQEQSQGIRVSSLIDDAKKGYTKLLQKIVAAAEVEVSMRKLLREIEKTKRRVNALEFNVIPKMNTTKKFISLRLEEMEREGVFRLKRIKA
ncbi:V-type ATP synthase subunit D [Candidatus Woesearchaeota archaeon]|nr:V-type ATP synthase subunit D [Candidatus Woesearchaeota archaeon]